MEARFIINKGNDHKVLYKYRAFNDFLFRSLENSEVYFADPAEFNDPFDCDAYLDLGRNFERDPESCMAPLFGTMPKDLVKLFRQAIKIGDLESIRKILKENFRFNDGNKNSHGVGVFCMSKRPDHLTAWSYYAESHSGLCLEFEVGKAPFLIGNNVEYEDELISVGPNFFEDRDIARRIMLRKSKDWRHEEEVRFFSDGDPGVRKFEKSQLKKIFFGIRAKDADIDSVLKILIKKSYRVDLFKAKRKDNAYGIDFERLG